MATSPEDVEPVLNYEREETTILEATERQPIELVVEESGSVLQLKNLVASLAPTLKSTHRPWHNPTGGTPFRC